MGTRGVAFCVFVRLIVLYARASLLEAAALLGSSSSSERESQDHHAESLICPVSSVLKLFVTYDCKGLHRFLYWLIVHAGIKLTPLLTYSWTYLELKDVAVKDLDVALKDLDACVHPPN
jgi:hypothetical protein